MTTLANIGENGNTDFHDVKCIHSVEGPKHTEERKRKMSQWDDSSDKGCNWSTKHMNGSSYVAFDMGFDPIPSIWIQAK